MSSKIEEQIKEQLKEQFHRAFYDNIKHSVETQNYDHIVRLYAEIQDRLTAFLKKDGPTYNRLKQDFDVPFFEQRLRNNAFDGQSLQSLIHMTFSWVHNLQMPIRDTSSNEAKDRVIQSGTTMAEVVPTYIKEVHAVINLMERDMKEFYENRNHPVVKEMLRKAVNRK